MLLWGAVLAGGGGLYRKTGSTISELVGFNPKYPKELLPINFGNGNGDRPIVCYSIENMFQAGAEEVCLVTSPPKEKAMKKAMTMHFGTGRNIRLVIQDDNHGEPVGTARAVACLYEQINNDFDAMLIGFGDGCVTPLDALGCMTDQTDGNDSSVLLGTHEVPTNETDKYGIVECSNNEVTGIHEKPTQWEGTAHAIQAYCFFDHDRILGAAKSVEARDDGHGHEEQQLSVAVDNMISQGSKVGIMRLDEGCEAFKAWNIKEPEQYKHMRKTALEYGALASTSDMFV